MRVLVTGAAGFVGSNVVHEAGALGVDAVGIVRSAPPIPDSRCSYVAADLLDAAATRAAVLQADPDAIVHTAILNDPARLYSERQLAWHSYVGVTHTLADAANEIGALLVTVSTDWVFDGRDGSYDETAPPNPVKLLRRAEGDERARHAGAPTSGRSRESQG